LTKDGFWCIIPSRPKEERAVLQSKKRRVKMYNKASKSNYLNSNKLKEGIQIVASNFAVMVLLVRNNKNFQPVATRTIKTFKSFKKAEECFKKSKKNKYGYLAFIEADKKGKVSVREEHGDKTLISEWEGKNGKGAFRASSPNSRCNSWMNEPKI
jgi:hypothetical protein